MSDLAAQLERDGHVTVNALLDGATVAHYRSLVNAAVARTPKLLLGEENEIYQSAFDQHMNLWQVDESVAQITLDPHLARTAAQLLGVEAVRVYHDQALIKVAGGGHTPWHQDHWYWPLDTDRVLTMWLPLHGIEADMGAMEFAAGTHSGPIGDEPISAESDAVYAQYLADHDVALHSTGRMAAGDASFHLGWTLHRANRNESTRAREVMTVIWFADGARVTDPQNSGQADDLARWLPGLAPGDLATSALNPLVG